MVGIIYHNFVVSQKRLFPSISGGGRFPSGKWGYSGRNYHFSIILVSFTLFTNLFSDENGIDGFRNGSLYGCVYGFINAIHLGSCRCWRCSSSDIVYFDDGGFGHFCNSCFGCCSWWHYKWGVIGCFGGGSGCQGLGYYFYHGGSWFRENKNYHKKGSTSNRHLLDNRIP